MNGWNVLAVVGACLLGGCSVGAQDKIEADAEAMRATKVGAAVVGVAEFVGFLPKLHCGASERVPFAQFKPALAMNPELQARHAANRLRVVGLEPGTVLRPTPGQREVTLRLQAIGAQQGTTWLLDGQWMAASDVASAAQVLQVSRPGAHRRRSRSRRPRRWRDRARRPRTGHRRPVTRG